MTYNATDWASAEKDLFNYMAENPEEMKAVRGSRLRILYNRLLEVVFQVAGPVEYQEAMRLIFENRKTQSN